MPVASSALPTFTGITPPVRACVIFSTPAVPAAAPVCPIIPSSDPHAVPPVLLPGPSPYWSASTSICCCCPRTSPLPATSTAPTQSEETFACRVASWMALRVASCGVRADSTAAPRITPRIGSPAATASESRLSTSTTAPSPGTIPWPVPLGDVGSTARREERDKSSKAAKSRYRSPAAQSTMSFSPLRSISSAAATAIAPEQFPASNASAPPIRSKVLVKRLASVLLVKLPVSSTSDGYCLSTFSSYAAIMRSISSEGTPRSCRSPRKMRPVSGSRSPIWS